MNTFVLGIMNIVRHDLIYPRTSSVSVACYMYEASGAYLILVSPLMFNLFPTIPPIAIKDGNNFVLGEVFGNSLPPRRITELSHQGTFIVHDYFISSASSETISIAGPTTLELKVYVHVLLDPEVFGTRGVPDISWSFQPPAQSNEYRWTLIPGPCSVTCGAGRSKVTGLWRVYNPPWWEESVHSTTTLAFRLFIWAGENSVPRSHYC